MQTRSLAVTITALLAGVAAIAAGGCSDAAARPPATASASASPTTATAPGDRDGEDDADDEGDDDADHDRRHDGDRGQGHKQRGKLDPRVIKGFRIAPVPLDLSGKDPILVGLGSYLVNAAGGCNDCHTNPSYAPGGNPFLGEEEQINTANYLAGGTPFGPVVSRNITPDENGRPAGLTREEFIQRIRTGVDEDGDLLQVMPWPVYRHLRTRDLKAIYEYLSAIPHAEPAPPAP